MADPNPARAKSIPPDQEAFLKAYESREAEMIDFLKSHQLITLPDYLGRFEIRQLPEAFKPTSPGGFMNPPGVYDKDPVGFFFIPTYNPESKKHGLFNPEGPHAGDVNNFTVRKDGTAKANIVAARMSMDVASSLVIHAQADDLKTDPSGNSGDRIACGVVRTGVATQ